MAHELGHKWTHERVNKASNDAINKTYTEYRQRELNEKGEKTGKALSKHIINFYFTRISGWFKIKDLRKLRQDIENDSIIKDQMADLDRLFMCAFGNYLTLVLITAHTVNNVDFSDEQSHENEVYESD